MGRQSRRLAVRLAAGASVIGATAFVTTRWQLRTGSAAPVCASPSSSPPAGRHRSRSEHLRALAASSQASEEPFDVLVVGGGVQGLYTAVDAALRGLRVALVEASDFGSGVSSQGPSLQPGPFPHVQRALRQRDTWWLRRAAETMRETTIWENVCPEAITTRSPLTMGGAPPHEETRANGSSVASTMTTALHTLQSSLGLHPRPPALHTLVPALHIGELVEFSVAACLCTLLSPFCGPWRPHVIVPSHQVMTVLPEMDATPRGGVRCCDVALNGITATCALLRTAEALGVTLANYAPLRALTFVASTDAHEEERAGSAEVRDAHTPPHVEATVMDALTRRTLTLRARTVINCAEAWVDQVRALCPDNSVTTTPSALSHHAVQSYLVVAGEAVKNLTAPTTKATTAASVMSRSGGDADDTGVAPSASLTASLRRLRTEALQVCSTLYSFSALFVLPWVNDCVLVGPCFSPLPALPVLYGDADPHALRRGDALDSAETILVSADGFQAQQARVQSMLKSCGVAVPDQGGLLSCLSLIVPVLASPQQVPWTSEVMRRGFHIDVATHAPDDGVASSVTDPFVHVYGGTLLQARLVAAAAVDAALHTTGALNSRKAALASLRSRTAELALCAAFEPAERADAAAQRDTQDLMARLQQIVVDTHAERVTDVLFRRAQIGYTSPGQAAQAAAFVATLLPALTRAAQDTKDKEIRLARRAIRGVALNDERSWNG